MINQENFKKIKSLDNNMRSFAYFNLDFLRQRIQIKVNEVLLLLLPFDQFPLGKVVLGHHYFL